MSMKRILLCFLILLCCISTVNGAETETPDPDALLQELPEEAADLLQGTAPEQEGFIHTAMLLLFRALGKSTDSIRQGVKASGTLLAIVLLCGICSDFSSEASLCRVVGAIGLCTAVIDSVGAMIALSKDTITELSNFSTLLLPVMAASMAVSGSPVAAGGLYGLTALFAGLLSRVILKFLVPGVYLFLSLATAEAALGNSVLGDIREFLFWIMEKSLRILMYCFTAFLSLTGVISGSADALALKTTKAAVSGMIPVVGSILSDASESLLCGTATIKNTVGIVGMIAVLGITILPVIRIGIQYLIMKGTAACSGTVGLKEHSTMLKHVTSAMGLLLAMTGICGLLLLISGVCYLKVSAF
jgi:stage III sporulation protein AE